MNHSVYEFERKGTELVFCFTSEGVRPIEKTVRFSKIHKLGQTYYNLAFGDYDSETDQLDDKVVTDNGDMRRVLRTVVSIVEVFFSEHPTERLHIDGSDAIRHSYYHKLLHDYSDLITRLYNIEGSSNGKVEPFKRKTEYNFLIVSVRSLLKS